MWIRFLADRPPWAVRRELVYGELLIGDRGGRRKLLASAIVGGLRLWTADPRFCEVAEELGVAYQLS